MKICPKCQQTYTDDNLNFCLNDGTVLASAGNQNQQPATVFMNQPRPTNPSAPLNNQSNEQAARNNPANYSVQPKKSSKTWIWAIGILCLVGLLCGGGIVGLFAIASLDQTGNVNKNTLSNVNSRINGVNKQLPTNTFKTPSNSSTSDDRTDVQSIDLESWVKKDSDFGLTDYKNDELTMGSKKKGFYYVVVASDPDYKTANATTKVTLRNASEANSSMGYGLVFHSGAVPLTQDYAFLVDTLRKKYRIVYHQPQKETAVVNWTNSPAILGGAQENTLEVRDENGSMDFFINGDKVNTVRNVYGAKDGVAGLYAGDAAQISFSNLEIRK